MENLFKPAGRLPRALAAASVQRYDPRVMQGGRKRSDSPASSADSKMSTAIADAMMLRRIAEGGGTGERLIDRLDIGARRGRGPGYRTLPPVGFLTADRRCTQSSTRRSRSHQVSPLENSSIPVVAHLPVRMTPLALGIGSQANHSFAILTSSAPTAAILSGFHVVRASGAIRFHWRVASGAGLRGFSLAAGTHRLNHLLIRVDASRLVLGRRPLGRSTWRALPAPPGSIRPRVDPRLSARSDNSWPRFQYLSA